MQSSLKAMARMELVCPETMTQRRQLILTTPAHRFLAGLAGQKARRGVVIAFGAGVRSRRGQRAGGGAKRRHCLSWKDEREWNTVSFSIAVTSTCGRVSGEAVALLPHTCLTRDTRAQTPLCSCRVDLLTQKSPALPPSFSFDSLASSLASPSHSSILIV